MINKKIAFIGAGNMGQAFALGLLRKKIIKEKNIILSDPSAKKLKEFKKYRVRLETDNKKAVKSAEIIILAIKPQIIWLVLEEVKDFVSAKQLIISVAAGIEIKTIEKYLGKLAIVRVMPNLCAKIGESVSCWVKNNKITKKQALIAKEILRTIGKEFELENEDLLDKITAISGSGPAYLFYLTELLENSAKKLGIKNQLAKTLAYQTIFGSAKLLQCSDKTARDLKESVVSKKGTTEVALRQFSKYNFDEIFFKAIKAASDRTKELRKEFNND